MKKRKAKERTLGDREQELRIRDKKLEKQSKGPIAKRNIEKRRKHRKPLCSLTKIQKRGTHSCSACKEEKPVESFYAYYDNANKLTKIWPTCILCDRKKHRTGRSSTLRERRLSCLLHYGKAKIGKLKCSSCGHKNTDALVLFDLRYKNEKALITLKVYKKLYEYKYPDIKFKLICYNCAHALLYSYKK